MPLPKQGGTSPPKKQKAVQIPVAKPVPQRVYSPKSTRQATRNATKMINRAVGFKAVAPSRSRKGAAAIVQPGGDVRKISASYNKAMGTKGAWVAGYAPQDSFGKKPTPKAVVMTRAQAVTSKGKLTSVKLRAGKVKKGKTKRGTETQILAHELGHTLGLAHPPANRPRKFSRGGGVMGSGKGYTKVQKNVLKQALKQPRRKYGGDV